MKDLPAFFDESLRLAFEEIAVLKSSDRGTVSLLRHRESRRRYICRRFPGSAEPYHSLIGIENAHLPRVYEAVQRGGEAAVLEEYVTGDTLTEILEGGVIPPGAARNLILQICDAVYALHSVGLVHRDIKPDNVIVSGDHAWLIDFDAARHTARGKEKDTRILGTVGYAPPEQFGFSQTDERSDIYAIGVLYNEMLTGEHPSLRLAAGRAGRVIRRCIMTSPSQRYRNIRALSEAL